MKNFALILLFGLVTFLGSLKITEVIKNDVKRNPSSVSSVSILDGSGVRNPNFFVHKGSNIYSRGTLNFFQFLPPTNLNQGNPSKWFLYQYNKKITGTYSDADLINPARDFVDKISQNLQKGKDFVYGYAPKHDLSSMFVFNDESSNEYFIEMRKKNGLDKEISERGIFLAKGIQDERNMFLNKNMYFKFKGKIKNTQDIKNENYNVISGGEILFRDPTEQTPMRILFEINHNSDPEREGLIEGVWVTTSKGEKILRITHHLAFGEPGNFKRDSFSSVYFQDLEYSINANICQLVDRQIPTRNTLGEIEIFRFPVSAMNLENWQLKHIYLGLRTLEDVESKNDSDEISFQFKSVDVQREDRGPNVSCEEYKVCKPKVFRGCEKKEAVEVRCGCEYSNGNGLESIGEGCFIKHLGRSCEDSTYCSDKNKVVYKKCGTGRPQGDHWDLGVDGCYYLVTGYSCK